MSDYRITCELGITDRSICSAGTCYACKSDRLKSALARAEAAEAVRDTAANRLRFALDELHADRARIAELEARLARVPDREAVARAIYAIDGDGSWDKAPDDWKLYQYRLADAAIAAMQETQP